MIITRAWDCGCQGWDVRNKADTRNAHARTLLNAILLYVTMRVIDGYTWITVR